jgi:chromosome partitioning protein
MPVIAVVNRKGGSGKTTLATHLAVYCAGTDAAVLLADVDRQHSTQAWLKRRAAQKQPMRTAIKGRALEPNTVVRPPAGFAHVILDTPGGLHGFDLMRVVMYADAILIPVGASVFDRESTADCYSELQKLPRVASGRCKVAAIGMRLDARTRAEEMLRQWAVALQLPFIGVLRETQAYVRCVERGLTLFDLPAAKVETDMRQWQPILEWLDPVLEAEPGALTLSRPTSPLTLPRAPAGEITRAPALATREAPALAAPPARPSIATRLGRLIDTLAVPRFLQRN